MFSLKEILEDLTKKIGVAVDLKLDGFGVDGLIGEYKDLVESNKLFCVITKIESNTVTVAKQQWTPKKVKKYDNYGDDDAFIFANTIDDEENINEPLSFMEAGYPSIQLYHPDTTTIVKRKDFTKDNIYLVQVAKQGDVTKGVLYNISGGDTPAVTVEEITINEAKEG